MITNKKFIVSVVSFFSLFLFFISVDFCVAQQPAPIITNYTYDPSGQRITVSNGTKTTVYPTKNYNVESNTQNLPPKVTKHIFANGQDLATIEGSGAVAKIYYNAADSLNSSSVMTDSAGVIAETIDYFPFGSIRIDQKTSTFNEQRKYIGQEFDQDTGLNYLNARYYNAILARFISQDSVFLAVGDNEKLKEKTKFNTERYLSDPQLANSYSYVTNNPLKYTDSTGDFLDVALDVGFIGYDLYKMGSAAWNGNWAEVKSESVNLGLDVGGALIPFATGLGTLRRVGETAKLVDKVKDAGKALDRLPDNTLVCRGGMCTTESFIKPGEIKDGLLSGSSVTASSDVSIGELTKSLKNNQFGQTTLGKIRALGGDVIPSNQTSRNPYHADLNGITPKQAEKLFTPTKLNPNKIK